METGAIREEIDRLIQSKTFQTSEAHRRLLQYLAERTLAGDADRLKEYTVGLEAFGKPPTYDPKHDSIVRLQMGRLRQKLAVYYQSEANGDPVRVSLPKGAFKLVFEPNLGRGKDEDAGRSYRRVYILGLALALVAVWAVAATLMAIRASREAQAVAESWSPELETLWRPYLESKRPLLISLGTPLFVRFPEFGFFRDPKVNDWNELDKSERFRGVHKALGDREILPSYNFTGAGEASAAFLLARLLATRKHDLQLTRSSILSWQQIADQDVIFLGPPKFNLQLQETAMMQDILVESDGIRNRKPRNGEPEFLEDHVVPGKPSEGETHALITRAAGPSGTGEFLMIAGNASPDTFAAAEWLTQPRRARELVNRLRTRAGDVPRHFQVVIKVAFKQGIPVQSSYVFHHSL
ncbi:MAG TPA: hypothetical protein VMH28_07425 [Candidatus Acidoferrales bacterium]|nr:hypothetical protein [Candidatus Acidoferrales bacterium]